MQNKVRQHKQHLQGMRGIFLLSNLLITCKVSDKSHDLFNFVMNRVLWKAEVNRSKDDQLHAYTGDMDIIGLTERHVNAELSVIEDECFDMER